MRNIKLLHNNEDLKHLNNKNLGCPVSSSTNVSERCKPDVYLGKDPDLMRLFYSLLRKHTMLRAPRILKAEVVQSSDDLLAED